jgi:tRNA A37 threonylcarbamoyladenosine dehydratase
MAEPTIQTREERLAAKLRENLRRRKAQARAQVLAIGNDDKPALPKGELKS